MGIGNLAGPIALCMATVAALAPLTATPLRAATRGAGLGDGLAAGRVITGVTPHRIIHFTFDDGPDPRTTPPLLDAMDRLGVRATFFFSASRFRGKERRNARAAEIARDALARGHSVGSHSVDHLRMGALAPAQLREQLEHGEALFRRVFGERTFLFRPPFGSRNRVLDRMLAEQRYTTVMWNVGMADWVRRSPEKLAGTFARVLERQERKDGQGGGVVLLHDTHRWSVDGFVLMVEELQRRNCAMLAAPEGRPAADAGAGGAELFEIVDDLSLFTLPATAGEHGADAPEMRLSPEVLRERQAALRSRERKRCATPDTATPSASASSASTGLAPQKPGAGQATVAKALGDGPR